MPKIRRAKLPEGVLRHLLMRSRERGITAFQLRQMSEWFETDPIVPEGRWFKRFPNFILCGKDDLPKTFLTSGQLPDGEEVF
jgi:hypothetical protein